MTVLCTNSGITYADIIAADAAESGNSYGVPTRYEQSGTSTGNIAFSEADYPDSFIYTASAGEETTGVVGIGAVCDGNISSTVTGGAITDLNTGAISVAASVNAYLRRLMINTGSGSVDGVTFNDTLDAEDVLVYVGNDGFLSSVVRNNSSIVRCTVIGATRFGYAQGMFTDCVDINSANQGYFNEAAGSSGTWEHDGTGTDTITESPATDIFVDFANGDYRIVPTSSVGVAGAGAFIQTITPPSDDFDVAISGYLPFIGSSLSLSNTSPEYDTSITGDLPFIGSSLTLAQVVSGVDASIDGNLPFITSTLELTQTLPAYNTSVVGDIPFLGSSVTATQTVPEYDSTINGSLPFLTSDLTLNRAAPEEVNVVVLGDLPFIGSSVTATQTVPEYDSTITGNIPFIGSNLNLTQAGLAEFNAVVLGDIPFLGSSLTTTQSVPEYDTSISGALPFISSTLTLTQVVSGVSASIAGNIPFISSSLSLSQEIPEYNAVVSGDLPFITSGLVLTHQDNSNNVDISGHLPFIGSSLNVNNQLPPSNALRISGNIPFITGSLFLVNREIEPVLTASADSSTDTYNITYQTLTYTVINEV